MFGRYLGIRTYQLITSIVNFVYKYVLVYFLDFNVFFLSGLMLFRDYFEVIKTEFSVTILQTGLYFGYCIDDNCSLLASIVRVIGDVVDNKNINIQQQNMNVISEFQINITTGTYVTYIHNFQDSNDTEYHNSFRMKRDAMEVCYIVLKYAIRY